MQFSIQNLLQNSSTMPNFLGQFGNFCSHFSNCWGCVSFFNALSKVSPNTWNLFNNNAEFFCETIATWKNPFSSGRTQAGIFIVFDQSKSNVVQHLGCSTDLHQYLITIVNGHNGTNLNQQNISNSSIFFLFLSPNNQSSQKSDLETLRKDIKNLFSSMKITVL